MLDRIKALIQRGNELGLPILVARDPATQKGSVTLSLVVVSSASVMASLVTSKVNNSYATEFFMISLAAYLGRMYQKKDTNLSTK